VIAFENLKKKLNSYASRNQVFVNPTKSGSQLSFVCLNDTVILSTILKTCHFGIDL